MLMLSTQHSKCTDVCILMEMCLTASSQQMQKTHCMHYLQAKTAPLTTAITPHVPQASSSGSCKGRGCNMYTGDGSGDYYGILAAKSQQSQLQPHNDLIAAFDVHLPSSPVQPDDPFAQQLQQSRADLAHAIEGALPSAQQPGNTHMQLQLDNTPAEQQPQRNGSSSLPGQQQVQPQGQSEEGRPSRQTERSTGQKKDKKKKKKKGPQLLECERLDTWGHDKFQEIQVFATC